MLRQTTLILAFLLSACVTVNIYFPAAAVERAADEIVKETWGGPQGEAQKTPQSRLPFSPDRMLSLSLVSEAMAQEADINVSNPAIRGLRESIKRRSNLIKPYMDKANVGINQDGLLSIRSTDGLTLKQRAEIQQLVEAENRDREALYAEIAKANNIDREAVPKIKRIFARSWIEQAQPGWWIQDEKGTWKKK